MLQSQGDVKRNACVAIYMKRTALQWEQRLMQAGTHLCQGLSIGLDVVSAPEHHSHSLGPCAPVVSLLLLQQPAAPQPAEKSRSPLRMYTYTSWTAVYGHAQVCRASGCWQDACRHR